MVNDFSHLQMVNYNVQIGDRVTPKVAIFNCNKLPTGVAMKCIETDTHNKYLLTMTLENFEALFLDDHDAEEKEPASKPDPEPASSEDERDSKDED